MTSNDLPQGAAENTISLLFGHPDPATLLTPELRNAMQHVISSPQSYTALQYGPEQGTQSLINFLVEKINREQGLAIQPANLMLVAGSTHAVDMLARLYTGQGGVMLVEAPTYVDAIHIFRDHQIELCSIPMDEHGLITSELEKQVVRLHSIGKFPSMLYTVPNFHNPTGSTLSEVRRIEIIRLARQYHFLIIQNTFYPHPSFQRPPPASFYALAHGKQVLSIGSFSKTLAPGLRLGWVLGTEDAIQRRVHCWAAQMGGGADPFAAQIVSEEVRRGPWEN